MLRGILQGQLGGSSSLRSRRRGNFCVNQTHGGFAENARGLALFVAINLATMWICGCRGDARGFERRAVGNGNVAINTIENSGMVASDGVNIGAGWSLLHCPQSMVPAATDNPFARRRRL